MEHWEWRIGQWSHYDREVELRRDKTTLFDFSTKQLVFRCYDTRYNGVESERT
jgi:hypothetical protein